MLSRGAPPEVKVSRGLKPTLSRNSRMLVYHRLVRTVSTRTSACNSARWTRIDSELAILSGGKRFPLSFSEDAFISSLGTTASTSLTAPLVFVGYGLKIPEYNVDDLATQYLRGKIVVYLRGSPGDVPGSVSAHYQSFRQRWKALQAAGVIGVISIQTPTALDIPWSRFSLSRNDPAMELNGPEFRFRQGLRLFVTFNPASAERLFAGSGHTYSELAALANERKALPSFPLEVQLEAKAVIRHRQLESANVIALIPGTDALSRTSSSFSPRTSIILE